MNQAVIEMLSKYQIKNTRDGENALKEIIQEIALLGLHRANFFEKAAFYGGTSLRILYSLPRYSEDLDFTLFRPDLNFSLTPYFNTIERELLAYGFQTEVVRIEKKAQSEIQSAFIKGNTKIHFLKVGPLKNFESKLDGQSKLKIKFEVDTNPSVNFEYETRYLLAPTSFPVISLKKPDLFAGKLHALLFRNWKSRVKGRDFYDFVWYLKQKIPARLAYLREKSIQSGHSPQRDFLNLNQLKEHLNKRFETVNFEEAKKDVLPFIRNPEELNHWNVDFFTQITEGLEII